MNKLLIPASVDGYTVDDPNSGVTDGMEGPSPTFRRGQYNNAFAVAVTWNVNLAGYEYLVQAYRNIELTGNAPFLIDLITNSAEVKEHHAKFEVGTFRLSSIKGHRYTVTATLHALPTVKATFLPAYPVL